MAPRIGHDCGPNLHAVEYGTGASTAAYRRALVDHRLSFLEPKNTQIVSFLMLNFPGIGVKLVICGADETGAEKQAYYE